MDGYLLDATAESDRWIDRQTDRHRDSERERETHGKHPQRKIYVYSL